jgi:hypothetical protein
MLRAVDKVCPECGTPLPNQTAIDETEYIVSGYILVRIKI